MITLSRIAGLFLLFPLFLGLGLNSGCRKREAFEILSAPPAPKGLPSYWKIPDFTLTDRSGKSVQLADFAGKVWVADFFYSSCPGPCPMLSSRLSDVQKEFASAADLRLVSISIDPEKDTPAVLQAYATKFKANDRWIFLTGEKAAIYRLAREGFKVPLADRETPDGLITHSARLMLIDQTGTVRGFYEAENQQGMADLFAGIRTLLSSKP